MNDNSEIRRYYGRTRNSGIIGLDGYVIKYARCNYSKIITQG